MKAKSLSNQVNGQEKEVVMGKSLPVQANGHADGVIVSEEVRGFMKAKSFCRQLHTQAAPEFIDITEWVGECVAQSQVQNGFAVVFSRHTTAAIKINENEPMLLQDMASFLEKFSPRHGGYQHNDFSVRTVNMTPDETPNGHAHLQHLLLGTSETIPILNGSMQVGRYQSIFFIELDHPRPREVMVQVVGV